MFSVKSIYKYGNSDIRLSNIQQFEGTTTFTPFSAKFVMAGKEVYHSGRKKTEVTGNMYLLGNAATESSITIDSYIPVKGICIDLAPELIDEVAGYHFNHDVNSFTLKGKEAYTKYNAASTNLGMAFSRLQPLLNHTATKTEELFYMLAECMLKDRMDIYTRINRLDAVKEETRLRLYSFINDARNYIDSHFLEDITLQTLAGEANISSYHFIRLFKKTFGLSPYQYILKKRLSFANELLKEGSSVTDTAYLSGFADIASFSKAYKKQYGVAPTFRFKQISNF
ncbi:AraC family transcriptional regulator [Flavobacterium coralii]|uniref:helix-turn-helix domain-containing protein n=1 Tax=Flavobacterium coralii TaxID=2838017 RepID=UPI0032B14892|tara:strand:+ start:7738 stop:8586 length:849 start_codon:yes stop_codon:yes gene_type:complete